VIRQIYPPVHEVRFAHGVTLLSSRNMRYRFLPKQPRSVSARIPFHQIGFRLVRPCCKVRRPETPGPLLSAAPEWSEVAALEVAKAERKTLQREVVLLAKMRSELARSRRTGQRAGRDKAVGDYLIFGGPENRKSIQLMAWIPNLRAVCPGAVITSGVNAG